MPNILDGHLIFNHIDHRLVKWIEILSWQTSYRNQQINISYWVKAGDLYVLSYCYLTADFF